MTPATLPPLLRNTSVPLKHHSKIYAPEKKSGCHLAAAGTSAHHAIGAFISLAGKHLARLEAAA